MSIDPDPPEPGYITFWMTLVDAGVLPDPSPAQAAYLEALDGTTPAPDSLTVCGRIAGRRYLRAVVAAHALHARLDVHFAAVDAQTAGRARDDALYLLEAYCAARGVRVPDVDLRVTPAADDVTGPHPDFAAAIV